jgi:hypothetical protein
MVSRILEISFTLILVYLVLANAYGFSSAVESVGSVYVSSVKALQGR